MTMSSGVGGRIAAKWTLPALRDVHPCEASPQTTHVPGYFGDRVVAECERRSDGDAPMPRIRRTRRAVCIAASFGTRRKAAPLSMHASHPELAYSSLPILAEVPVPKQPEAMIRRDDNDVVGSCKPRAIFVLRAAIGNSLEGQCAAGVAAAHSTNILAWLTLIAIY
jgi:hypothetical protein